VNKKIFNLIQLQKLNYLIKYSKKYFKIKEKEKTNLLSHIKAILLDLDGTLLTIDLNEYVKEYIKGLALKVARKIPPNKFIPHLLKAGKIMENNDGKLTNEEIFNKTFFPFMGYSREDLEPIFLDFYQNDFPKLKKYTKKKPEARRLIQKAIEKRLCIVIATTPLLPMVATAERLQWADIADFSYNLITSYENMKSTKPNLLYYKQILEVIGHTAKNCMMVGDEDKDMVAKKLGLTTFLVSSPSTNLSNPSTPRPDYTGTLNDLVEML